MVKAAHAVKIAKVVIIHSHIQKLMVRT